MFQVLTKDLDLPNVHVVVLPGGDYTEHIPHEGGPVAAWLRGLGIRASTFRYPLRVRHPGASPEPCQGEAAATMCRPGAICRSVFRYRRSKLPHEGGERHAAPP